MRLASWRPALDAAFGFGRLEHPDGAEDDGGRKDDGVSDDQRVLVGRVANRLDEQWSRNQGSHEHEAEGQPGVRASHLRRPVYDS
jgi:hypothetical protein